MDNSDFFEVIKDVGSDYTKTRTQFVSLLKEAFNFLFMGGTDEYIQYRGLSKRMKELIGTLSSANRYYPKTISSVKLLLPLLTESFEKIKRSINSSETEISEIEFRKFRNWIVSIYNEYSSEGSNELFTSLNTNQYYTELIERLKNRESELSKEITNLKQEKHQEYQEKEEEIKNIKLHIQRIEDEKEELSKKLDAINSINLKIKSAFEELRKHVKPLKTERRRLNWMFGVFAALSIIVLVILICFEIYYLSKWEGAEQWIDYIPYYIPVPIVGGLLWAFICQMNRAQRQLLQLANVLYHIDYCEGLLLAINNLNLDINTALAQINGVLSKMIDNYMSLPNSLSEQNLDAQISKDSINLNSFIDLAKEVKDIFK